MTRRVGARSPRAYTRELRGALGRAATSSAAASVEPRPVDVGAARGPRLVHARPRRRSSRSGSRRAIGEARRRVRIASPVITAAPILGDARRARRRGARRRRRRASTRTQTDDVFQPVGEQPASALEDPAARAGRSTRGRSRASRRRRGRPGTVHDFMHAKVTSPTTPSSSARSTSRARASRTPRTCSRSTTRRSPSGWPPSSTRSARATRR